MTSKDWLFIGITLLFMGLVSVYVFTKHNTVFDEYEREIKIMEQRTDSLTNIVKILREESDSLCRHIDSSKGKVEIIKEIKYEKISNVTNLAPDSVLSILSKYLSEKSPNR